MSIGKEHSIYNDYIRDIWNLSSEEHIHLLELISNILKKSMMEEKTKHSILELEGLGVEIWEGIDAQEYVHTERKSWE